MTHKFTIRTEPGDLTYVHPGDESDCVICGPARCHGLVLEHGQGVQCKCICGWESGQFRSYGSVAAKDFAEHAGDVLDYTGPDGCILCGAELEQPMRPDSDAYWSGLCQPCLHAGSVGGQV